MATSPIRTLVDDAGHTYSGTNPMPVLPPNPLPVSTAPAAPQTVYSFSSTLTTSTNSADLPLSAISDLRLLLNVTAVSGTSPSLQVFIDAKTAAGNYVPIGQTGAITAAGTAAVTVNGPLPATGRVRWVIGGVTPSFTTDLTLIGR